jgi:hypothetical protein
VKLGLDVTFIVRVMLNVMVRVNSVENIVLYTEICVG